MTTRKTTRSMRALATTLGAAVLATLGFAGTALAADANLVDPDEKASLTITKFEGETGVTHDGSELGTLPSNELLAGASFDLYQVTGGGIDVTTNPGWSAIAALTDVVGANPSMSALTTAGMTVTKIGATEVTGTDGIVNWAGLDLGLYYVVESGAPAGKLPIDPFLVTLPMTTADGAGWNYNVFVYPKDAAGSTKEPLDGGMVQVGDELVWRITVKLPEGDLESLKISDVLDSALDYVGVSVTTGDSDVLDEASGHYSVNASGQNVTVTFESAGLTALKGQSVVYVDIKTTVNDTFTEGAIDNTATITQDNGKGEWSTTTPVTSSKYGTIEINKTDDSDTPLAGAQFEIYWSDSDDFGDAVAIPGRASVTTDGSGAAKFEGLRLSDFANGKAITSTDEGYIYYWLVETAAPSGYQVLAQPVMVELTEDASTAFILTTDIVNIKHGAGIELPLTGGVGTLLFLVGGVALIAGTVFLAVGRKPKKNQSA